MLQTVPPAASDAHRKSVLGRAPRGVTRRYPRVLLGTSLVLLVLGSARGAAALCTANELCGASANPCVISGAIRTIGPACVLDFGSRAVQITTTLKAEQARGSFELRAGTLTLSGKLLSTGSASAPGGTIRVQTSGAFQMTSTADIDLSGGLGGGDLVVVAGSINWAGGSVKASGTSTDGGGGSISLVAGGSVVVAAALTAEGGRASGGGPVEITGDDVTVRASINVDGGNFDGGSVTITAADALSVLGSTTQISSHGALADEFAGYGGDITLSAGGNLRFEGQIESLGAAPDASGGFVDLSAGGSVELVAGSTITSTVASGEGTGGDVSLGAGLDVTVAGVLDAGGPAQGFGGNINVAATRDVTIATSGRLRVDAGEMAGMVSTHSPRLLTAAGLIDARGGSGGLGGDIILGPHCRAVLRGTFYAGAAGAGRAGSVQTLAATLAIEAPAVLTATPCSTPSTGCIRISLPAGSPSIDTGTTLNPTAVVTLAPSLRPCCGDGTLDVGETCDDGNRLFCDGCNSSCDVEGSPACPADGRLCTADCHPTQGCVFTNEPDGSACWDDGSVCTTDTCASGWCRHDPMVCNDGIACTTDSCHATLGCTAAPDNSRCDDRIACTVDTCSTTLGCTAAPDNSRCDDSIACTTDACSTTLGCTAAPDNSRCNDGVACTTDACSTTLGCTAAPDNSRCNDGVACTNDTCSATLGCTAAPDDSRCDDGVACTNDTCDALAGCRRIADNSRCDDGIACTNDTCDALAGCVRTGDDTRCADGNPCTSDRCQSNVGCRSIPGNEGATCEDGSVCTLGDRCVRGACAGRTLLVCDDDNRCTTDRCEATTACVYEEEPALCSCGTASSPVPAGSDCADGEGCTAGDQCDGAGLCQPGAARDCNDGDACTSDICSDGRCTHDDSGCATTCAGLADGTPCSDGQVCNVGTCASGACVTETIDCDDGSACTGAEFCTESEGLGCVGSDASPFASMCRAADDYRCYKARIAPGNRPPPTRSVQVATVFGTRLLRTGAATLFCDPVSTDAAGRIDAAAGLGCYQLRADKGDSPPPARTLRIRNVFGLQSLSVREPANTLCLPSTVGGVSMAGVHDERACFTVRGRRFPGTTHGFLDAFEDIRATVLQPIMLCLATARDGVAASAPEEHLLCYRTRAASSVTTSSRYSVSLSNDFDGLGPQALGTTQAHSICVPTRIES